jgi:uncharacterized protein (TIGR03086 family)
MVQGKRAARPRWETVVVTDFAVRYVTLRDPLKAYERTADAVGRLVTGTSADQLGNATPCPGWTVRDVVNHLVETLDMYGALASRGAMPVEGEQRFYDDPIATFATMAASCRAAFAVPGFLDVVADTPIGPQPGRAVVQHVVNELTVHGWDLARGTAASTDLVPDVAEAAIASWRAFFDNWDRAQLSFNFLEEQPAPEGASPADRLAAYLGRTV